MKKITSIVLSVSMAAGALGMNTAVVHAEESAKKVAYISAANQFDFFVYIGAEIKKVGEENGVQVDMFDAALDVSKEADLMSQAILQKYDAIIVGPVDTQALIPSIKEANDAGIPVINYDSFIEGAEVYARVGSGNKEMGETAGEYAADMLKEKYGEVKGNVIVLSYPALETMNQRSEYKNPKMPEYQSKRDLVGEITDAVRARGMKMGLYYSGIFDWTFKDYPIDGMENWVNHHVVTDEYAEYSWNQTEELIHKYKPSILWNDIGFPAQCDLNKLYADYYNTVPEGVINDRWRQYSVHSDEEKKRLVEKLNKQLAEGGISGILVPEGFCDYTSPEYANEMKLQKKKWELTRGMGMSFGYNQNEDPKYMLKTKEIIYMLVDAVSKNGNLLLNVGPRADGSIQDEQKKPLLETGKWLKVNGEAIYETTYWEKQEAETEKGQQVRFTKKGNQLYAVILDEELGDSVVIKDLEIPSGATVTLLGEAGELSWEQMGENLAVKIPENIQKQYAYTLKISC